MKFPAEVLNRCWFLAGPTASGKTALSLELASRLKAEILSMDSMAVYRCMDIGTAKASPAEQSLIPHHLIDLVDPHEDHSVAEYCDVALKAVLDVLDRDRVPLFTGGTGLYLRALLRGVFDGPPANWALRHELQDRLQKIGAEALHQQLGLVDPVTAERLHPNDHRRIIRALEVHQLTGKPLSALHANKARPVTERPAAVLWLEPPRDWLRSRIDARVDLMMDAGLLEETRQLLQNDPPPGRTARQALGYRELIAHLEDDQPLPECVDLIRLRTKQFAKRQHTWFRNLEECEPLPIDGTESVGELADQVSQFARQ